ncbi:MAG TPA: MFS transporter [Anaerolineales bacterium]|nr:MFS transporter [Anaerolineales bacterium]
MKLSNWQKILYSSGALGVALSYLAFGTYIQFLYIDILGVKASLVGIGWSLYGIWNAFNDPIAGFLSDNTNTKWGRRIPWIASAFIPLGLFFYLLWVPPNPLIEGGEVPLFIYFIGIVLVFDTLWTFVAMNWTALFPEMIRDEKERATVSGLRQAFTVVGLLLGVALPPILVGQDWSGRGGMALTFGAITSLTLGLSLLGSRENPKVKQEKQPALLPSLTATFRNRSFRWFVIANLHKEFIVILLQATTPFWAKYVLNIQSPIQLFGTMLTVELQNSLLLGSIFIMTLPGIPFWTWVAKRLGSRRGWQISQATFALSMLSLYAANNFNQAIIGTSVIGLSLAGLLVFPDLLIADIIDEDETVTGARREGAYFGINGFLIRFAFTMQGITTAVVLSLSGYIPSVSGVAAVQPATAIFGIRAIIALVPIAASLVTIAALQMYPLHSARLQRVRVRIGELKSG